MRLGEEGVQMEERKSTIGISESEMRETSNGMQATAGRTVQIKRHAKSAKFAASLASRAGRKDRRNSPSSSRRFLEVDDDEYVDACIECNRSGYTQIFNCRTVLELCVVVLFTVYHLHSLTMCESRRSQTSRCLPCTPCSQGASLQGGQVLAPPPTPFRKPVAPAAQPRLFPGMPQPPAPDGLPFTPYPVRPESTPSPPSPSQSHRTKTPCGADPLFIAKMKYAGVNLSLSVHDPAVDNVISMTILGGSGRYGSISEVEAICHYSGQDVGGTTYSINCGQGKLFVEVGSALGHVTMYLAARGMRAVAIDPLDVNIRRMRESMCLNGLEACVASGGGSSTEADSKAGERDVEQRSRCAAEGKGWGNFAPNRVRLMNNLAGSAVSSRLQEVRSNHNNLAATNKGTGQVSSMVSTTTVDYAVGDEQDVELLLLTCQGHELSSLRGAGKLLSMGKVKNVILRLHAKSHSPETQGNNRQIIQLLLSYGFTFFNIENSRSDLKMGAPEWIGPSDENMLAYSQGIKFMVDTKSGQKRMFQRHEDQHINIFGTLVKNSLSKQTSLGALPGSTSTE